MLYEFSLHSLEQLKLRSISKDIIEIVIKDPDEIIEEPNNQHIFQKRINNYLYRVFINSDRNPSLIKTVYRTSKINKY